LSLNKISFTEAIKTYEKINKLERIVVRNWHDFGHVNTYFKSRSVLTTERSFNKLDISGGYVTKSSANSKKIKAEAMWFLALPEQLKRYIPQFIYSGEDQKKKFFYATEYLPIPPLNEIYVHGKNPPFFWKKIFYLLSEYFLKCKLKKIQNLNKAKSDFISIYEKKTWERLDTFFEENHDFSLDTEFILNGKNVGSIRNLTSECVANCKKIKIISGIFHGDLCFSNVLFDSRSESIKVVDPRGLDHSGKFSLTGNLIYDLAKLAHSVIGMYDHIIAEAYVLKVQRSKKNIILNFEIYSDPETKEIQNIFYQYPFLQGIAVDEIMPLVILLFLSMLPLHNDKKEKQYAFIANAFRLAEEYTR
jgi:hypothetical protein